MGTKDSIDEFVERVRESMTFDAIIAACTELPIALDHARVGAELPIVSSNRVLAHALVDTYYRMAAAQQVRPSSWPLAAVGTGAAS